MCSTYLVSIKVTWTQAPKRSDSGSGPLSPAGSTVVLSHLGSSPHPSAHPDLLPMPLTPN